jgi:hypothetical protein
LAHIEVASLRMSLISPAVNSFVFMVAFLLCDYFGFWIDFVLVFEPRFVFSAVCINIRPNIGRNYRRDDFCLFFGDFDMSTLL